MKVDKSESAIASKKLAQEKRREKNKKLATLLRGGGEPSINPLDYKISLIHALNWYNVNVELKEIRSYLNDYLVSTNRKKLVTILKHYSDFEIRSVGLLSRLKNRQEPLSDNDEARLETMIDTLVSNVPVKPTIEKVEIQPVEKVDTSYEQSLILCEDIESAIDDYVKHKTTKFDASAYLKAKDCNAQIAKHIADYYSAMVKEMIDCDGDGYRFTKTQFKKYIQFIQSIVDACAQRRISVKVRKPRTKKPTPPSKVVSKLKYCKEHGDLKLKSIKPETIVDCTELWVYNTRYRKLVVYKAEKNGKLTVKGTTILGFDLKESKQVMLRKPEEFFKTTQLAKRALSNGFKTITTKPVTPNGRINEDTILLGAFT